MFATRAKLLAERNTMAPIFEYHKLDGSAALDLMGSEFGHQVTIYKLCGPEFSSYWISGP
jgi:hypothetical protein